MRSGSGLLVHKIGSIKGVDGITPVTYRNTSSNTKIEFSILILWHKKQMSDLVSGILVP